ncbi:hypothetical protein JVT61DRAFT_11057 [Boletus reticuloceps]|uniref:Myb-like domain-containing protein n=1 Tax=Boletus reticuloceps TaxID=495285 RepID=A0A8I2YFA1_9AGAM|nr:hypothetical protein JVT61DRAFT_11057 [Boletus reticuloceps]
MDNPQHYQPLSHALNPPIVQPQYEEEEEEGDDEGAVEEQLEREDDDGNESNRTPQQTSNVNGAGKQRAEPAQSIPPQPSGPPTAEDVERKRRPGRPRGSKNRRIRSSGAERDASAASTAAAKPTTSTHGFYQYSSPPAPGEVHPHNQQYYEFQWRILNLCAEFYGAAEELIKATPSLVIAQCYQMGPGVKVDPLTMLSEAKRICDTLLASPARLTAHPPPVPYPFIPGYTPLAPQPSQPPLQPAPPSTNGKPPSTTQSATSVISNPQSFVVSMGHQHQTPQQFVPGMYSAPAYPTAPYYGYSGYSTFYPSIPAPQAGPSTSTGSNGPAGPIPGSAGNQGAWSDEETEKLKKLAEEHRNANGEIAWDALCERWGNSRTRHQILIKATSLGLKESSSRGTKRRRDTESQTSSDRPPGSAPTPGTENPIPTPTLTSAPPPPQSAAPVQQNTHPPAPLSQSVPSNSAHPSASPAPSTPVPSTQPSPAIRHAQTQQQAPSSRNFPYPMPTVAAATSPVISTTTPQQPQERSGNTSAYYRRPNPPAGSGTKVASHGHGVTTHQYMYQPNGRRDN